MTSSDLMPPIVGVRLTHAAVQAIAESAAVDVLHIKGPAVDASLLPTDIWTDEDGVVREEVRERHSMDADVLVRPDQVSTLIQAMANHDWHCTVDFADGSAFEHAATMGHTFLAHVDLHRYFPGFGPDAVRVFNRLWRDRQIVDIAGRPCAVPSLTAQRLVLILNAARGGPSRREEVDRLWRDADTPEREEIKKLAAETGAGVALAVAIGDLRTFAKSREHDLWVLLTSGNKSPVAMWRARVRAQPTMSAALREAVKLVVPNPRRLAFRLGRPLTKREIVMAWVERFGDGLRALVRGVTRPAGRRR